MTTPTDYRALCAELTDALDAWQLGGGPPEDTADADLIARARAALAQSEPQNVSYGRLLAALESLIHKFDTEEFTTIGELEPWKDLVAAAKDSQPEPQGPTDDQQFADFAAWLAREIPPGTVISDPLWWAPRIARAVLARWGRPAKEIEPQGPTDEEWQEFLSQCLTAQSIAEREGYDFPYYLDDKAEEFRARFCRPAIKPVPVGERLPGPEECDAEGECYWFDPAGTGAWYLDTYQGNYTHWLPRHALPVPQS